MVLDATHRSGCPINLSLEVFGDRWSLIVLRDIIFGGRRHFRELMRNQEGISSNILADRLKTLVEQGMLTKSDDPSHKQKAIYSLTEMSISTLPILASLGAWGRRWLPVSEELSIRARLMEEGGAELLDEFMDDLREEHLGATRTVPRDGPTVRQKLQAAYEAVVERQRAAAKGVAQYD
jgi:DNA-binding HxlR family transcriptional regulator